VKLLKGKAGKIGLAILALSLIATLGAGVLAPAPVEAAYTPVPPYLQKYVEYAYYGGWGYNDGVELKLTEPDGINFGKSQNGANLLAYWEVHQPEWKGSRSQANVASEIKWHCQAWGWIPWLRSRLNPVNIEYFQNWPQSAID